MRVTSSQHVTLFSQPNVAQYRERNATQLTGTTRRCESRSFLGHLVDSMIRSEGTTAKQVTGTQKEETETGTNVGLCPGSGCPFQITLPVLPVPVMEEDLDIVKEGLCTDQNPPRTSPRPGGHFWPWLVPGTGGASLKLLESIPNEMTS